MRLTRSSFILAAVLAFNLIFSINFGFALPESQTDLQNSIVKSNERENKPAITKAELQRAISQSMTRVDEFEFIKKEAEKLGVKVYLFGGTAAAFAHYVKWDLLRQKGDSRFNPNRFDYKYINIYRSTQDLDIVVDGPHSAISSLSSAIVAQFPYLQGSKGTKNAWEVRSLREDIGDKLALLNNPDFLNQHTDSNSVGMIEITDTKSDAERIRDLKDWNNVENSGFLNDVIEGKIHYYYSQSHESTRFYKEGRNPPIISVIRYFIKVFQLDLEMRTEEIQTLKRIIADFDPKSLDKNSYLPKWVADNAPKLIQNAIDLEFAFEVLDQVGLRDKLKQIGDPNTIGSVSWWMHKEPLRSFQVGGPHHGVVYGKTAQELELDVVSHETTSFLIYEAITRSHKGLPNVLISRTSASGEAAAFGDGFYTMKGNRSGFRGSGFTIRFKVNPNAREGSDFLVKNDGSYIIILNRNAIRVIPESLSMDLEGYYRWLLSNENLSRDDLGIFQRLRLSMRAQFLNPSEDELDFLNKLSTQEILALFGKDPAIESKVLLLGLMPDRLKSAKDVLSIFGMINKWSKQASKDDQKSLLDLINQKYKTQFLNIFLKSQPRVDQLQEAMDVDLFYGNEVLYLELVKPYLHSIDDILSALQYWHRKTSGKEVDQRTRSLMLEIGKQFFSLNPNTAQVDQFQNQTKNEMMVLALGSNNLKDPIVFARLLSRSLPTPEATKESDKNSDSDGTSVGKTPKTMKVWYKYKDSFFALKPHISELSEALNLLKSVEIQIDIINYSLDNGILNRRKDFTTIFDQLTKYKYVSEAQKPQWQQTIQRLVEAYIKSQPSPSELASVIQNPAVPERVKAKSMVSYIPMIHSDTDLISFLKVFKNGEKRNDFLEANPDFIKQIQFSSTNIKQLLQLLEYRSTASNLVINYAEQNPSDYEGILELFRTNEKMNFQTDRARIEKIWFHAVEQNLKAGISFDSLTYLITTLPSVEAYRYFMPELLKRAQTLEEFKKAFQNYENRYLLHLSESEWNEIRKINDQVIPETLSLLESKFFGNGNPHSFYDFQRLPTYMSSSTAIVRTFDFFVRHHAWSSYATHFTSVDLDPGHLNRKPLSADQVKATKEALALYAMTQPERLTDAKLKVSGITYGHVLQNIFQNNENLKKLGLIEQKNFLKALYRVYLLQGTRTIQNNYRSDNFEYMERDLNALYNDRKWNADFPYDREFKNMATQLYNQFKDLPKANYGDKNGRWAKFVTKIQMTRERSEMERELGDEFNSALKEVSAQLLNLPDLVFAGDELLGSTISCRSFQY